MFLKCAKSFSFRNAFHNLLAINSHGRSLSRFCIFAIDTPYESIEITINDYTHTLERRLHLPPYQTITVRTLIRHERHVYALPTIALPALAGEG